MVAKTVVCATDAATKDKTPEELSLYTWPGNNRGYKKSDGTYSLMPAGTTLPVSATEIGAL